jgi:hypothetical protein
MKIEPKAVLARARALIAFSDNWTQNASARKQDGTTIDAEHPLARRWCSIGACRRALRELYAPTLEQINTRDSADFGNSLQDAIDALDATLRQRGEPRTYTADYNDEHTHADALALFDQTLARLQIDERTDGIFS